MRCLGRGPRMGLGLEFRGCLVVHGGVLFCVGVRLGFGARSGYIPEYHFRSKQTWQHPHRLFKTRDGAPSDPTGGSDLYGLTTYEKLTDSSATPGEEGNPGTNPMETARNRCVEELGIGVLFTGWITPPLPNSWR
jgi:hypothetical protein